MSALPKRPTLLSSLPLPRRTQTRALQSFSAPSPLPPPPAPTQYPPPPYPALLLPHPAPPHPHPHPRPTQSHRPPKKSSTTLFPPPPPSPSPSSSPAAPQASKRPLLTWHTPASAQELEERDAAERGDGGRWRFRAGAAGLPKHGGACVTRGGGVVQVGEDCYFVLPDSMGVSDGVGGLKGPRCNPGLFALSLISHASSLMSPSAAAPSSPSSYISPSYMPFAPSSTATPTLPLPYTVPPPPSAWPPAPESTSTSTPEYRAALDPHPALLTSHALTLAAFALEGLHGSATCTLARLYPKEGLLRVAHVGDCELWCVRGESASPSAAPSEVESEAGVEAQSKAKADAQALPQTPPPTPPPPPRLSVVFRTPAMQRSFNHPFQLSTPTPPPTSSPSPNSNSHSKEHAHAKSSPPEIATYTLPIQPRDIVLLSSDGLADNLWEDEILAELSSLRTSTSTSTTAIDTPEGSSVQLVCERLVRRAKAVALARHERERARDEHKAAKSSAVPPPSPTPEPEERGTPFERKARESGKLWKGGKNDDISVVLAVIDELPAASAVLDGPAVGFSSASLSEGAPA